MLRIWNRQKIINTNKTQAALGGFTLRSKTYMWLSQCWGQLRGWQVLVRGKDAGVPWAVTREDAQAQPSVGAPWFPWKSCSSAPSLSSTPGHRSTGCWIPGTLTTTFTKASGARDDPCPGEQSARWSQACLCHVILGKAPAALGLCILISKVLGTPAWGTSEGWCEKVEDSEQKTKVSKPGLQDIYDAITSGKHQTTHGRETRKSQGRAHNFCHILFLTHKQVDLKQVMPFMKTCTGVMLK